MMNTNLRNDARKATLSGRPCLRLYTTNEDINELIDKSTFQRMYNEKWGGAPWLGMDEDEQGGHAIITLDNAPASSSCCSSTLSSEASSAASTRQHAVDVRYISSLRNASD